MIIMELDPNKTIEIIKPCKRCGCEISPLKTDYTKMRVQCNMCNEITIKQREEESTLKRKLITRQIRRMPDSILPRCNMCKSTLPKHKSAYCSQKCSSDGKRISELSYMIERAKIGLSEQKKKLARYEREYQKILEDVEAKRNVIEKTVTNEEFANIIPR
tara:strand:- start:1357 stop:1836 length:480 start_codon:yes stop_codon:yes gene_type:complete